MTAPAQQQTQPPPPPPPDPQADERAALVIAAVVAAGYVGTDAATKVAGLLVPFGIARRAAIAAWQLAHGMHGIGGPYPARSARQMTARIQVKMTARYVVAAARRIHAGIVTGKLREALTAERRYAMQHLEAQTNRQRAAAAIDVDAARHGPLLGWYSHHDERASSECRAAHGHNFRVDRPPAIGYPGAVHPHCRCQSGPPWLGGAILLARPTAA